VVNKLTLDTNQFVCNTIHKQISYTVEVTHGTSKNEVNIFSTKS